VPYPSPLLASVKPVVSSGVPYACPAGARYTRYPVIVGGVRACWFCCCPGVSCQLSVRLAAWPVA